MATAGAKLASRKAHWENRLARRRAVSTYVMGQVVTYGVLILISCGLLLPLFWALSTSLKEYQEVVAFPPVYWPPKPKWENYYLVLTKMQFLLNFRNTLIIALGGAISVVTSSTIVAYGFAKGKCPLRDAIFIVVLATMMLPGFVTFIPVFVMFYRLHLTNTFGPFLIPGWLGGGAWNIFLLRQFFKTIPDDLLDAARVDGASEMRILGQLVVPLAKPALATIFLFAFMGGWSDYFGPFIYLTKRELFPFSLAIARLRFEVANSAYPGVGGVMTDNVVMAASLLVSVPLLILFLFTQQYFIEGIALTGIRA